LGKKSELTDDCLAFFDSGTYLILFDPPAKFLMEEQATAREILQAFLATRMDIFYRLT